ncbi:hypothetical protein [Halosimplex sp. TS25]|uniref:hypothetical protein n=1 Tax=Halosimplex rarum TaxID=3396619 RepID=UPI0039E9467A
MADSYTDGLTFRRKATRNWPITIIAFTTVLFSGSAVLADVLGYPSIAGIISAYLIAILLLLVFFAIIPVYALELLD